MLLIALLISGPQDATCPIARILNRVSSDQETDGRQAASLSVERLVSSLFPREAPSRERFYSKEHLRAVGVWLMDGMIESAGGNAKKPIEIGSSSTRRSGRGASAHFERDEWGTSEEIMRGDHVEREDIEAAMHYVTDLARERIVPFVPGAA